MTSQTPEPLPVHRIDEEISASSADEGLVAHALSPEARREIEVALGRALAVAGPAFGDALREFQAIVARAEPIVLMGALAMYCGTFEVGTNPEFNRQMGMFDAQIELVQAVAIADRTVAVGGQEPPAAIFEKVAQAAGQVTEAWIILEARKVATASPGRARDLALTLLHLRVDAMQVRGWGYTGPLVSMLKRLFSPLDDSIQASLGWRPTALVDWWVAMRDAVNERLNNHRSRVREAANWPVDHEWLPRVRERFGTLPSDDDEGLVAAARSDESIRQGVVLHSADLRAHEIFRFELKELVALMPTATNPEVIRSILDEWSLNVGHAIDTAGSRFIIENPVQDRPFVHSAPDHWHLFCGWLLLHNAFGLIERLLERDSRLFDAYLRRRSEFLEEGTAAVLKRALPEADVKSALSYTHGADAKEYEADVVVVLDSYAIVAEAKSGRIGPEARRGKRRQLRDRIADLLVAPSDQAHRLAETLKSADCDLAFRSKRDGGTVTIDCAPIRRVIPLGITLEPIALSLPRLADLAEAGLSERAADALAYSVSLTDLEVVVSLLDHPCEFLHYLGRRAEIERRSVLVGDEADLLGLYLKSGFNLGEKEFEAGFHLSVVGMSDPIDRWHYAEDAGSDIPRPRVERTPWWEAVLTTLEKRRPPRWTEIGTTVCNVAPPEQRKLEAAMRELREGVNSGRRRRTDFVVFQNGPQQRRDVFAGLIASPDPVERERQYRAAAGVAMEASGLERIVVLAWTPFPIAAPYSGIGLVER